MFQIVQIVSNLKIIEFGKNSVDQNALRYSSIKTRKPVETFVFVNYVLYFLF